MANRTDAPRRLARSAASPDAVSASWNNRHPETDGWAAIAITVGKQSDTSCSAPSPRTSTARSALKSRSSTPTWRPSSSITSCSPMNPRRVHANARASSVGAIASTATGSKRFASSKRLPALFEPYGPSAPRAEFHVVTDFDPYE